MPAQTSHPESTSPAFGGIGGASLALLVCAVLGLALNAGACSDPARSAARHDRGSLPRQVEQFRSLAESIVRVATKNTRTDRHVPIPGVLTLSASAPASVSLERPTGYRTRLARPVHRVRVALLDLPPPAAC
ncbi:MAG: hypothetical protein AB7G11_00320 [Phycisphaerales bacterium]